MNFKNIFSSLMALLILQSCATTKNMNHEATTTFWVGGFKTEASAGAGKMPVLNIHKGENLNDPEWENFYANIEGFEFEEGYLQKIEVKEEKLDRSQVPADASSIKYTLVNVLEKQKDLRTELNGKWTMTRLNDRPLNRMVAIPDMAIDLSQKMISGNSGCNNFTGMIQNLTPSGIDLGPVAGTRKACLNKNIESEFNQALNEISTYQIKGNHLTFYNEAGEKVLAFMKEEAPTTVSELDETWQATRIFGNPINRMSPIPGMQLNLISMQVTGDDGCNNFSGKITSATGSALKFGTIASTRKMCRNMEVADRFNRAISKTASYKIDGKSLTIYDEYGNEVLSFITAD